MIPYLIFELIYAGFVAGAAEHWGIGYAVMAGLAIRMALQVLAAE